MRQIEQLMRLRTPGTYLPPTPGTTVKPVHLDLSALQSRGRPRLQLRFPSSLGAWDAGDVLSGTDGHFLLPSPRGEEKDTSSTNSRNVAIVAAEGKHQAQKKSLNDYLREHKSRTGLLARNPMTVKV